MTRDEEVELLVKTIQALPSVNPDKENLRSIWHRCSFSGWLRGDFESDAYAAEWSGALKRCQGYGLVSVRVQ